MLFVRRIKHWYYQRKIKEAIKILNGLDQLMRLTGYSRHDRKQFWRDFIHDRSNAVDILNRAASTGPSDGGGHMRVGRRSGLS